MIQLTNSLTVNFYMSFRICCESFANGFNINNIWKSIVCFISIRKVEYVDPKNEENIDEGCTFDRPAQDGKYCPFKIESLDNCSPGKTDKKYGFPQKKPCVYLKLNKVTIS